MNARKRVSRYDHNEKCIRHGGNKQRRGAYEGGFSLTPQTASPSWLMHELRWRTSSVGEQANSVHGLTSNHLWPLEILIGVNIAGRNGAVQPDDQQEQIGVRPHHHSWAMHRVQTDQMCRCHCLLYRWMCNRITGSRVGVRSR